MCLGKYFGLKRDEIIGGWRKLQNEEPHNVYSSTNIVRMIKSRRMRWVGHIAGMKEGECMQSFGGKARGKETTMET
jgi:hypothetical protein